MNYQPGQRFKIEIEGFPFPYITPPMPKLEEISGYKLPNKQQKWKREIFPNDEEIKLVSEEKKREIIERDFRKRLFGHWFMNNGVPTYITGDHYFYLTHWYIAAVNKDGYPEYRKASRLWEYVCDLADKSDQCAGMIMTTLKRSGKALSVYTDIPTPDGWRQMIDLQIGDYVFGKDGYKTKVTFVSDVMFNKTCYEIIFSDGERVIADAEHRWIASDASQRAYFGAKDPLSAGKRIKNKSKNISTKIVTTQQMADDFYGSNGYSNWSIENTESVIYDKKSLEIPPYILGIWLGDGSSYYSKITNIDKEIIDDWVNYGKSIGMQLSMDQDITYMLTSGKGARVNPFMDKLRHYDLLNNKHIPQDYLSSCVEDRIDLLRGLMDTDGCRRKNYNNYEFCSKHISLINEVYELVTSLGMKATKSEKLNKKYNKPYYYLRFTSFKINPFKLSRKSYGFITKQGKGINVNYRYIQKISRIDSVPVKCIQVDNESHTYLCTKSFIVTHNTEGHLSKLYNRATLIDEDCLFGLQSLTSTEAKNNLFKGRIMRSHKKIPNYLKPVSNETGSRKEIVGELTFMGENIGKGLYKAGLNNVIDHRPTLVSAYQGKRPKMIFLDEPGSVEEMDIEDWWTTVKQQLSLGKKFFGKAYLPTTLETMKPKGAPLFQKIWNDSDPLELDENGRTRSGLWRYFKPQYSGREDFIDEYGNDMVDDAKRFRQNELDNASPEGKRKIKRQYPETVEEAFDLDFGGGLEAESILVLEKRLEFLNLKEYKGTATQLFEFNGQLEVKPVMNNRNEDEEENIIIFYPPMENVQYEIGIDGTGTDKQTSSDDVKKSLFSIVVTQKYNAAGGSYSDVAELVVRPEKLEQCYKKSLLLAKHYNQYGGLTSMKRNMVRIWAEGNIGTAPAIVGYFESCGALQFLQKQRKYFGTDTKEELNRYCFYRDGTVRETQLFLLNQACQIYGGNFNSRRLIRNLLKIGKEKADIGDAFQAAILGWGAFHQPAKEKTVEIEYFYENRLKSDGTFERIKIARRGQEEIGWAITSM